MLGQHDELVAAQPDHHVVVANAGAQPIRRGDQHLVAGIVPEGVVDPLEVVEIQEQQRDGALAAGELAGAVGPAAP